MQCARLRAEQHWQNVGYTCALWGKPIEVALTKDAQCNQYIREGYARYLAKQERKAKRTRPPGFLRADGRTR